MESPDWLHLVSDLASAVRDGGCRAVAVEGVTGSGRTYAISTAAAGLREQGFEVWELRGARAETAMPLAAVSELVPRLNVGADPLEVRHALIDTLQAADWPVAICIDDADLVDQASLAVLGFAARRVPSAFIASTCSGTRLDDIIPEATVTALRPLADATVGMIVDAASAVQPTAEVRRRLIELADGNPGAAHDLAASLSADQLNGVASLVPLRPTRSFATRFLDPLADPDVRTIALLLACEPGASMALLERAAARLGVDASAVDALEATARIDERDGRLHLLPSAVGPALYSTSLTSDRLAAHRALAEACGPHSHRRIWHAAQAATEPDENLALELEQSTEPAFRRGGAAAVSEILQRAAALSPDSSMRGHRLAGAAEAAWLAGNPERGRALLFAAQDQSLSLPLRTEIAYLRGSIELAAGSVDYAITILRDAAAERLSSAMPRETAGPLLIRAMDAAMIAGDAAQAAVIGKLSEPLLNDTELLCQRRAASVVGTAQVLAGDPRGLELVTPITTETSTDAEQPLVLVAMRTALIEGNIRRLASLAAAAADRLRESGAVGQLPFVTARLAMAELLLGRLDNAASLACEGLERSRMLGQRAGEAEHLAVLALADARRGQADEAIGSAEGALRLAAMQGLAWPAAMATWALGDLQLSRGEPEQALVRLETLWHGQRRERHPLIAVFAAPELVEAAVRAKSPGRGDVAFEQLTSWAGASGQSWAGALVERCRFLRADHPREADVAFARCLALHAEAAHPYDLARSQLAYGELLRRSRRRADSRQFLRSAVEGFENLGAVIWEQRARTEVRASGETLRQRGDHTTLDELTPQEETIARLVAQGRTNRDVAAQLFLSVRTVEFHLRNIFVKLGVTSRVELVSLGDLLPDPRREKLGDSRL